MMIGKAWVSTAMAAALVSAAAPALADGHGDKAVQARRGFFQMISLNFGPLVGMAKGEVEYDAAVAETHATNLAMLGKIDMAFAFPAGSDNAAMSGKTRALPKIWEDLDGFVAKATDYSKAADAIAAAAPQGLDALRPAVGALGQTCKACHDDYRAKDF